MGENIENEVRGVLIMEMQKTYNPKDFEDRIYADWENSGYFRAEIDENKVPFTIMMPPPNITGQLHMGHALDLSYAYRPGIVSGGHFARTFLQFSENGCQYCLDSAFYLSCFSSSYHGSFFQGKSNFSNCFEHTSVAGRGCGSLQNI